MSSILLANPYVPQGPAANTMPSATTLEVIPTQQLATAQDQGGAASFENSGNGASNQADTIALIRKQRDHLTRPQDATLGSVINAQTAPEPQELYTTKNLPEVKMPDPLPTYPFLKPA